MTSVVGICNRALSLLGQKSITSLEDNDQAARLCAETYGPVRDAVLRDHPWNCAIARADLAPLSERPAFGFGRQFELPADCLRVLELWGTDGPWKIEGRRLLTDATRALIRYIRRVEDPNQFDALLVEAIAARLAADLCEPITQKSTLTQSLWELYGQKLRAARSADAQEGTAEDLVGDVWLTARLGYGR
jgi:hypothetical protein